MNLINKALFKIFSKSLKKNKIFKDLHSGQSCYIFGNGTSLQYYDLKLFNDRPSIGCNALFAHKDVNSIDLKYYYVGHPFLFHKFWKNPYSQLYEKNRIGIWYKKKMKNTPNTQYFTSLSNYFGIQGKNINYVYHFGSGLNKNSIDYEMDEEYTMMSGALTGMIGMALYMGFTDITLVGCDYTFSPMLHGHFFEKGAKKGVEGGHYLSELLNVVEKKLTVRTITPNEDFQGEILSSMTYKDLVGQDPIFKENQNIISKKDLKDLDSINMNYKIF